MVLTRWFGVTVSDADRSVAAEKTDIEEIAVKSLLMQKNAATAQTPIALPRDSCKRCFVFEPVRDT